MTAAGLSSKMSVVEVARIAFPTFEFLPWSFHPLPRNFWDDLAIRRAYVDWLTSKKGLEDQGELRWAHFSENGGSGLLKRFGGSPSEILKSLSSDVNITKSGKPFEEKGVNGHSSPSPFSSKTKALPKYYWDSKENQRLFMDELARKLTLPIDSSEDLTKWYSLSRKDIIAFGGRGLLAKFDDSVYKILQSVYFEKKWEPWRFERRPRNLLRDTEEVVKLVKTIEDSLKIASPEDWYRVSIDQLKSLNISKIFYRRGLIEMLRLCYPDVRWNERFLLGGGYKKASQKHLFTALKALFPNQEILEEYIFPELISSSIDPTKMKSKRKEKENPMRFDIFLPHLNLAIEYQGQQHYEDQNVFGDSELRRRQDEKKAELCKKKGVSLVQVPYWWDKRTESLVVTLLEKRPDLSSFISASQ